MPEATALPLKSVSLSVIVPEPFAGLPFFFAGPIYIFLVSIILSASEVGLGAGTAGAFLGLSGLAACARMRIDASVARVEALKGPGVSQGGEGEGVKPDIDGSDVSERPRVFESVELDP